MDIFNVISGVCSIASLIISLFVANKAISISNRLSVIQTSQQTNTTGSQAIKGNNNKQAGGNIG